MKYSSIACFMSGIFFAILIRANNIPLNLWNVINFLLAIVSMEFGVYLYVREKEGK